MNPTTIKAPTLSLPFIITICGSFTIHCLFAQQTKESN